VKKSTQLMHQVMKQTFTFLKVKSTDFMKAKDQLISKYELRLMECEDNLALEKKKSEAVIKNRTSELDDRIRSLCK
jgi:hypothetical protein